NWMALRGFSGMARVLQVFVLFLFSSFSLLAQTSSSTQDWPSVGHDAGGNRHSSLTQINRSNVTKLQPAWTFDTGDVSDGSTFSRTSFAGTPLIIDNVLYIPSPTSR